MKKLLTTMLALTMVLAGCSKETTTEPSKEADKTAMKAGTYEGKAVGMDGEITVAVTVDETTITKIEIKDENETEGVGDEALYLLSDDIVEHQSIAVDSIAGATISSNAMKNAVSSALEQAGADLANFKNKVEFEQNDETFEYDVVVVGGGIAGLMSAAKAKLSGANVALVEKLGVIGGSGVFSSGIFLGANSEATVESFKTTWVARNKLQERNQVSVEKVEVMSQVTIDALKILDDSGFDYTYSEEKGFVLANSTEKSEKNASSLSFATASVTAKGGAQLINHLEDYITELGVDIYMNTSASSLITDAEGNVTGVVCTNNTGTKTFNAKAVILATGGYARNDELALQLASDTAYNYTAASAGDTGDGIIMALEVGAAASEFGESMSGVFCADPYDMPTIGQKANSYPFECLLVNGSAVRPVSEDAGSHTQMVDYIYEGEADYGWVVMDQEIANNFVKLDEYLEKTASGSSYIKAYKADSIAKLAELMGVDATTLQATVDRYNELCAAGEDTDCNKDAKYLSAIDDGCYYAVKEYDMTRSNYGGIQTNTDGNVLNTEGGVINGLYAAGIISSGDMFGDYYPGGEALAVGVYMGYICGDNATAYAQK